MSQTLEEGVMLGNKKGDSNHAIPLNEHKKRQRYPYIIRTPLPVTVLGDCCEKGKAYPYQPRLFLSFKTAPLSEKGKACPISNRAIIALLLSFPPPVWLSIARNSLALLIVWTGSPCAREPVHQPLLRVSPEQGKPCP